MNLQITKSILVTGILTATLFSCSKDDNSSDVLSVVDQPSTSISEPAPDPEEPVIVPKLGVIASVIDNENKTATFSSGVTDADVYEWSFPGALPETSSKAEPGMVSFPKAGEYKVSLEVTIDDQTYKQEQVINFD